MMIMKFINCFYKKKKYLNYIILGNHVRDFTYVGDAIEDYVFTFKKHNRLKNFEIFNICSNKPVNLKEIISFLKK